MTKRDYYNILDVARSATEAEIKSAYRKLALKYHPDRNPGDTAAEDKFKAAAEAYAILADPQKRSAYDQFGHAGVTGAAGRPDFDPTIFADFGDILAVSATSSGSETPSVEDAAAADRRAGRTFATSVDPIRRGGDRHRDDPTDSADRGLRTMRWVQVRTRRTAANMPSVRRSGAGSIPARLLDRRSDLRTVSRPGQGDQESLHGVPRSGRHRTVSKTDRQDSSWDRDRPAAAAAW